MKSKNYAIINANLCVACGTCLKVCPVSAISISNGCTAYSEPEQCIGCGKCAKACPASIISINKRENY